MMEEAQETYQAVQMLEREGNTDTDVRLWKYSITDGIGDTAVTLILLAELHGVPFTECLQAAYDEIKGRVGAMVDGTLAGATPKYHDSTVNRQPTVISTVIDGYRHTATSLYREWW